MSEHGGHENPDILQGMLNKTQHICMQHKKAKNNYVQVRCKYCRACSENMSFVNLSVFYKVFLGSLYV